MGHFFLGFGGDKNLSMKPKEQWTILIMLLAISMVSLVGSAPLKTNLALLEIPKSNQEMLRHPPDSEYWARFITKRSQNPAKRSYNPGFYNPSEYLGTNPDPKSENEYWTRFVTKRSDPDKDYWTRFVKRENTQGQEVPGNDYWTRFVKREDTSKRDKKYLASVMRSIPLETFGPAEQEGSIGPPTFQNFRRL